MEIGQYQNIVEKIREKFDEYTNCGLENNTYALYLANGDSINIKTFKNNIAHLLGVNMRYLEQSNKLNKFKNSYEKLEYFLDESYAFQELARKGKLDFNLMFSEYVDNKIEGFSENIKLRSDDIMYVIKYDKERTYQVEDFGDICDYYIVRNINNKYYVLGLVANEKEPQDIPNLRYSDFAEQRTFYVPVTNRKYDSFEEFEKFMLRIAKKQEITYPYLYKGYNPTNSFDITASTSFDAKKEYIEQVLKTAKKYDATAAAAPDFLFHMNLATLQQEKKGEDRSLIQILTTTVRSGNVLDDNTIKSICGSNDISYNMRCLIDACNDAMVYNTSSPKLDKTYSDLSKERDMLKQELKEVKQQLLELRTQNEELETQNVELTNKNNMYEEQFDVITQAVQKIKK